MVLSKVGAAESAAMRSISARFSAIAASSAGFRSAGLKRPNGGTPPQGPCQGASSGLTSATAGFSLERAEASSGFFEEAAQAPRRARARASAAVRRQPAGGGLVQSREELPSRPY